MNDNYFFKFGDIGYDLSSRTFVMGVLNVTPDSFSDGGTYLNSDAAVARALEMEAEGADIIDIGGESTRPGAEPVSVEEELKRVIPVIKVLNGKIKIPISVDTSKSAVAEESLKNGAHIINDVTALNGDEKMAETIAGHNASVILMHMKGNPKTMQDNPDYENVMDDVRAYLEKSIWKANVAGINQIIVDPGIGFGKTVEHNLQLIKHISKLKQLDAPVLLGISRKSMIQKLVGGEADDRLEGTIALNTIAALNGANILRVHDVKPAVRVAKLIDSYIKLD